MAHYVSSKPENYTTRGDVTSSSVALTITWCCRSAVNRGTVVGTVCATDVIGRYVLRSRIAQRERSDQSAIG